MKIEYSPRFEQLYKKLPSKVKTIAEDKEIIFRKNPFDKRLKTHKLKGSLRNYWAFWLNYKYRIIFSFEEDDIVRFHAVGTHTIYKKPGKE